MGVQETAPAVQTLNQAGAVGRSCKGARSDRAGGCNELDAVFLLTDGRQRGSGRLHTGAVVQRVPVGAGADWAAGAQQTEPLTFLPVTWIIH